MMSSRSNRQVSEAKLPDIDDEIEKKASFEAAKKKFAMYGKQNDHVDHLLTGNSSSSTRSGTVDSSLSIKNTHLLQENGEVAAQLDDLNYHLDGILGAKLHLKATESIDLTPTKALSLEEERLFGHANSILDLAGLLQIDQLQSMISFEDGSMNYAERITRVVMLLKTVQHESLKLALGVFGYFLSSSTDLQIYLDDNTIIAILSCMRNEIEQPKQKKKHLQDSTKEVVEKINSDTNGKIKKTALKRKQNASRRSSSSGGDANMDKVVTFASKKQEILTRVAGLLKKQEVFCLDEKVQVNLMDILTMTLHNCLQVDGGQQQNSSAHTPMSSGPNTPNGSGISHSNATETFQRVLQRKKLLTSSGGLKLLTHLVKLRFKTLKDKHFTQLAKPTTFECILALHHLRIQLKVLDQASFLASEVQETLSKDEQLFDLLLQLIEALSDVAWGGAKAFKKWQSDQHFMHLVVEVLLASNRVLINLTHHNEEASQHVYKFNGTKTLFLAFCKLWSAVGKSSSLPHHEGDKFVFDAFLMSLSALTNCVEYSKENREALTKISLSEAAKEEKQKKGETCLETYQYSNVCALLVSFFLNKIKSYEHQLNSQPSEDEEQENEDDWVPEDVILGGCCSLLLGCLMKGSSYRSAVILGALPNGSPELLLRALSAFVALHSQLGALTPEVGKSVLQVEKVLKSFLPGSESDFGSLGLEFDEQRSIMRAEQTASPTRRQLPALASPGPFNLVSPSPTSSPCLLTKARLEQIRKAKQEEAAVVNGRGTPPAAAFKYKSSKRVCADVNSPVNEKSNNNRKTKKIRGNLDRVFDKAVEEQKGSKPPMKKETIHKPTTTSTSRVMPTATTKRQVKQVVTISDDPFDFDESDEEPTKEPTTLRKKTSVLSSKKSSESSKASTSITSSPDGVKPAPSTSPQKIILNRKKKKSPLKSKSSVVSSNPNSSSSSGSGNADVFDFDG